MDRRENIISDAEADFGLELDGSFGGGILCEDTHCRHSECDCWQSFDKAVREQLQKQEDLNAIFGDIDEITDGLAVVFKEAA